MSETRSDEIHGLEAQNPSIWCRFFGHKFDYNVVKDTEDETIVDATCQRNGCDYDERLTEDSFNA